MVNFSTAITVTQEVKLHANIFIELGDVLYAACSVSGGIAELKPYPVETDTESQTSISSHDYALALVEELVFAIGGGVMAVSAEQILDRIYALKV